MYLWSRFISNIDLEISMINNIINCKSNSNFRLKYYEYLKPTKLRSNEVPIINTFTSTDNINFIINLTPLS